MKRNAYMHSVEGERLRRAAIARHERDAIIMRNTEVRAGERQTACGRRNIDASRRESDGIVDDDDTGPSNAS